MENARECFLIDDDIEDQEIFQLALQEVGQNISLITANDGAEGLLKLKGNHSFVPDYIFLDLNMPKMNGMQCLQEIRRFVHLKNVKIIMFSTSSDAAIIQASKQMGAQDFLVKPDKISLLVNKLSEILEK